MIAKDGKEMILIPVGPFIMGSEEYGPERPRHRVTLEAYYIDKYPVTNAEYSVFVKATGHKPLPRDWPGGRYPDGKGEHAVQYLTWHDASAYAEWAGKRLPTEAEWEKAASGADGRRWPWVDEFDESRTVVRENAPGLGLTTVPVTAYPEGASPYGVCQMAGHVEEWVQDWYEAYPGCSYRSACFGKKFKVVKGGSYHYTQQYARCAYRRPVGPDFSGFAGFTGPGFRCALSA